MASGLKSESNMDCAPLRNGISAKRNNDTTIIATRCYRIIPIASGRSPQEKRWAQIGTSHGPTPLCGHQK